MKIGFTGTRNGLRPRQAEALRRLLRRYDITEFHHGCCIGADTEASLMVPTGVIWQHPSNHPTTYVESARFRVRYKRLPPLVRDRLIVDSCDTLLACPEGVEVLNSGTWTTVRYARVRGKPIKIVWPDGRITDGNEEEPD